jgi:subtilisin family serine protease
MVRSIFISGTALLLSIPLFAQPNASVSIHTPKSPPQSPFGTHASEPVIVEFKEPPLSHQPPGRRKRGVNLRDRLLADLGASAAKQRFEPLYLEHTFHGTALVVSRSEIARIRSLTYVKAVYPDVSVQAFEVVSGERMSAPAARQQFNVTGKGVRIGIIDSGVDFMHPVLGGGFGDGFKVSGGWDFVENDAIPQDNNGHGTHVASIAAGSGAEFSGIAPDATLFAYRVLDENGRGRTSHILAAMDRVLDPNGDGDYSDRMHIVNMSLGSEDGLPSDPAAVAADRLMQNGVLVVVAAGNSGYGSTAPGAQNNYMENGAQTIGAPATSELALTVGSIKATGAMSEFSSKGPVPVSWALKPELVAVGSAVTAAVPGGGMAAKSGTSMAAPAVAGLAALLLEKRPGLSPHELKGLLTASAQAHVSPVFMRGAGEAFALAALRQSTTVTPSSLSFGFSAAASGPETRQKTVEVKNLGTASKSYTVSVTGAAGFVPVVTPSTFTLQPGESRSISIVLTFSAGSFPLQAGNVLMREGELVLQSDIESSRIPWILLRGARTVLRFTAPDPVLAGLGPNDYFTSWGRGKYNHYYPVAPDKAELIGLLDDTFDVLGVFEKNLDIPHLTFNKSMVMQKNNGNQEISHAQAVYQVTMNMTDASGKKLSAYDQHRWQFYAEPYRGHFIGFSSAVTDRFMVPQFAQDEVVYVHHTASDANRQEVISPHFVALNGVSGPVSITNSIASLRRIPVQIELPLKESRMPVLQVETHIGSGDAFGYGPLVAIYSTFESPVRNGETGFTLVTSPRNGTKHYHAATVRLGFADPATPERVLVAMESQPVWLDAQSRVQSQMPMLSDLSDPAAVLPDTIRFGNSPVFPFMRNFINLMGKGSLQFDPLVRGAHRETRADVLLAGRWEISDASGTTIRQGAFNESREMLTGLPDAITLKSVFESPFRTFANAKSTYVQPIDFTRADPGAPTVAYLRITGAQHQPKDRFEQYETVRLRFNALIMGFMSDRQPHPGQSSVQWRKHGDTAWTAAPTAWSRQTNAVEGLRFEADLSAATGENNAAFDIKLSLADSLGNRSEFLFEPAFTTGNWQGMPNPNEPQQPVEKPLVMALASFPNPFNPETTVRFSLPQAGFTEIAVFDVNGRRVAALHRGMLVRGEHSFRFDAESLASGVYVVRAQTGNAAVFRKITLVK